MILNCSLSSNFRTQSMKLGLMYLSKMISFLNSEQNLSIKIESSKCLIKMTKLISKSFDSFNLNLTIPALLNHLYTNNQIGINICMSIKNIIMNLGDADCNKATSKLINIDALSSQFENIFVEMLRCMEIKSTFNSDHNLALHCFVVINTLISYSSHDKQDRLIEMLLQFMTLFPGLGYKYGLVYSDLEAYFSDCIRSIIKRLIKPMSVDEALKIVNIYNESFERRKAVYEEGLLALSSLAYSKLFNLDLKGKIEVITDNGLMKYIELALQQYKEPVLSRAGIIAVGDILKGVKSNFNKYTDKLIPLLVDILKEEEVVRRNKLLVITLLGDIAFEIQGDFTKYLSNVMEILMNACELALMDSENDEETEEYLQELRFSLIECFSLIFFGLDEGKQAEAFSPYVPPIFNLFTNLLRDRVCKPKVLNVMLGFVLDMIHAIGKNITNVMNSELLVVIVSKLKPYSNGSESLRSRVAQGQEVMDLI